MLSRPVVKSLSLREDFTHGRSAARHSAESDVSANSKHLLL